MVVLTIAFGPATCARSPLLARVIADPDFVSPHAGKVSADLCTDELTQLVSVNERTALLHQTVLRDFEPALPTLGPESRAILLRMREGAITADAQLDIGERALPIFAAHRIDELKRLPSRKAAPTLNPML